MLREDEEVFAIVKSNPSRKVDIDEMILKAREQKLVLDAAVVLLSLLNVSIGAWYVINFLWR